MDPEQIYSEVLSEEQGKGSAGPVAEARAKAARQRAVHGSPHPKEAKWWAGAQPHLEGGGDAAPAEQAEEEPAAEAEEAPAAEAATPDATPAHTPADAPTPEADSSMEPAVQGGEAPVADQTPAPERTSTPAPAPVPAEAPAAAAAVATAAPSPARPSGVTHGTATGNRLRPEDTVATEAQFQGQQAMYDRRKLIDELVATGVPAVSAEDSGRRGSPLLAVAYILIPLLALMFLAGQEDDTEAVAEPTEAAAPAEEEAGAITVVAANIAFDTETLPVPAGEPATITLDNQDAAPHNIAFYKNEADGQAQQDALWDGEDVPPAASVTYETTPVEKGNYYFQCDIHPNMNGEVTAE